MSTLQLQETGELCHYIQPFLLDVKIDSIADKVKETLGLNSEEYADKLLNKIDCLINGLKDDFKNGDYKSNYIGIISLINNYLNELSYLNKGDSLAKLNDGLFQNYTKDIKVLEVKKLLSYFYVFFNNIKEGRTNYNAIDSELFQKKIKELYQLDSDAYNTILHQMRKLDSHIVKKPVDSDILSGTNNNFSW